MRIRISKQKIKTLFATAICLFAIPMAAVAQSQSRPQTNASLDAAMRSMFGARPFQQAAISPDGKRVAWVESSAGEGSEPSTGSTIYASDLNSSGKANRISAGNGKTTYEEHDLAWSPDSKRLVLLSNAASKGQLQVFTVDVASGKPKQLTKLKGFLSGPAWSPDGNSIAFLFTENATRAAGPLVAETPDQGVVSEDVHEQRLTIVDPATLRVRQISPEDLYVYEFDWSPDSKRLVATAAHGSGDDNWYIASLLSFDANSGGVKTIIEKPGIQISEPRWSPDGRSIVLIGGLMSDEAIVGGDIYTVPTGGGTMTNLTAEMKMSASWIAWSADSSNVIFAGIADGGSVIARVDFATHKVSELWRGEERVSDAPYDVNISLALDGKTSAVVRQSFTQPPEVWVGAIGNWNRLTHRNSGLQQAWGKSVGLHWTTGIGTIQGWLTYPKDFDPSKKYPLVVRVHGGPSWAVLPYWPTRWDFSMALPSQGYFVLQPNPRGSYGQGESFTSANRKDWGGGDFKDILAGVDEAIKSAPIDPRRVGITGWSYGGYMTMWGVTQTNRFRAAVAGAGISNLQSYYGENKVDQSLIPFMGASVYDDPVVYLKSSPINFIKNVKTPTLVVVGDSDGECPAPQSYEFWHALKTFAVPTQLVIYPREGHHFSDPAHSRDLIERAAGWFNLYMQASN
jgi:dipeptidyl aminopeptidase/acylaminoacyl peptidase